MNNYIVWTDGSYKSSIDAGGYSAIITQNNKIIKVLYEGFKKTTNNRMELQGVLATLEYFKNPSKLIIYSDSSYVVNNIMNGHAVRWIETNDLTKKNLDIWFKVVDWLSYHDVELRWVKGHNDNKMNELSDLYAQHAARAWNLKDDGKKEAL